MSIDKSDCEGCEDDFYNGKNPMGIEDCWLFEKAELAIRFQLHYDSVPTKRANFQKMNCPKCFHRTRHAYYDKIPHFAE